MTNPDPIQQRIEIDADTQGAEETKRALDDVRKETDDSAESTRKHADATDDAGKKSGFFAGSLDSVTKAAGGMIAGFFGFQTIIQYFNDLNEAAKVTTDRMREIAEAANEAAAATLDLQAINLGFSERDEQTISDFSQSTGRSFQESARAFTGFKSSTASLAPEEQEKLFNEALLPFALTTSGSVEPASKFIGRASQVTQDPQELTNLMIRSIGLAGESDPAQFLGTAGELLVTGNAAGINPAGTLSLLGFLTKNFETAEAGTGLRNVINRLTSNPEVREQLTGMGIDTGQGFFSTINQLADQGVNNEQVVGLLGPENARFLTAMLADIDDVNSRREQSIQAVSSGDLVGDFNRELAEESPRHAKALQIAQQRQRLAALQRENAFDAQDVMIARNAVEERLEKAVIDGVIDASAKEARLERFDKKVGGGISFDGRDSVVRLTRKLMANSDIPLTPQQQRLVEGMDYEERARTIVGFSENMLTQKQLLAGTAQSIETASDFTDLVPGGDQSAEVELSDFASDELFTGPDLPRSRGGGTTIINNNYINNGTEFRGYVGDPRVDDQDGRDRE